MTILVTVSKRRHAPGRSFALLSVDGSRVVLRDRDGAALVDAPGGEVRVAKIGSTMVQLVGPDGRSWWIVGPHSQLAAQRTARSLIERYGAVVTPPPTPLIDAETRQSLMSRGTVYDANLKRLAQHIWWQPLLLQLFWSTGARPVT